MIFDQINPHPIRENKILWHRQMELRGRTGLRRILAPHLLRFEIGGIRAFQVHVSVSIGRAAWNIVDDLLSSYRINNYPLIVCKVLPSDTLHGGDGSVLKAPDVFAQVPGITQILVVKVHHGGNTAEAAQALEV